MTAHLPALLIIIPLMTAPVLAIFNRESVNWVFTCATAIATFAVAIMLLGQVLAVGTISYHLGGWAPPIGIEFRIDLANAFVILIIASINLVVVPYSRQSVTREIPEHNRGFFYVLHNLCFTGLLGMTATGDAFNVFVFMEIASLSTYGLVAMGAENDRRALKAAYQYLILGSIGATFFVIGVGFLYMMTGTLNMADLAARLAGKADNFTVMAGISFVVVGLGLKAAILPLHLWMPNAYAYAPSPVSAFQSATSTKVAIYLIIRFLFTVFAPGEIAEFNKLETIGMPIAIVAMFVGSLIAIYQVNIKRMLAFSSVSQIGYIILGVSLATAAGLSSGLIHLFNHALIKAGMFMAVGAILWKTGGVTLEHFRGLGKTMPWTMAAFVGGGLGLIGVPTTAGFVSKWFLITAAFDADRPWLAGLIVLSSLLAVIYVWRVVEAAYFKEPAEGQVKGEAPLLMLIPTWVLILASFFFGINATLTGNIANQAAVTLMGLGG